eukprot:CAMPEP_0195075456 /NCGR_PEP_ID=MMETSP0448-20130528/18328_1 /TAXON_ID=66468 /ORGANISM="Heterocapsa triquestra, Strain CCMP 448" /LENGTH=50 /DNA_ID=CAMNT_0040107843 /DNA_START=52 /DNA_END=204 /DNA_ORIENTATION=+
MARSGRNAVTAAPIARRDANTFMASPLQFAAQGVSTSQQVLYGCSSLAGW